MKAIFTLLFLNSVFASDFQNEVIYGVDNRVALENFTEIDFLKKSISIATMVKKNILEESFGGILTKVKGRAQEGSYSLCRDEPNARDFVFGTCSGFLVAPDLLATAAHCVTGQYSCDEHKWIFEFRDDLILKSGISNEVYISSKSVYGCKEIVSREYDVLNKIDYALIKLDRPVNDRPILAIRADDKIPNDADLVMIGYGLGLPLKVSPMGKIINNDDPNFFKTNLDAFVGNSGSPVFNLKTGLVEGILVRGHTDFILDEEKGCDRLYYCPENGEGCQGEDATRITLLTELISPAPIGLNINPEREILEKDDDDLSCFFSITGC